MCAYLTNATCTFQSCCSNVIKKASIVVIVCHNWKKILPEPSANTRNELPRLSLATYLCKNSHAYCVIRIVLFNADSIVFQVDIYTDDVICCITPLNMEYNKDYPKTKEFEQ